MRRLGVACLALAVVAALSSDLAAATVKSGRVEAVSPAEATISVKFRGSDAATVLKVVPQADIRLDGVFSDLSALKPGMSVIVQVGSEGQAERLIARAVKDKPATPSAGRSTSSGKPSKSKPKPPLLRQSSMEPPISAAKSKSKSKGGAKGKGGSPLDSLPTVTTPLGGTSVATTPLAGKRSAVAAADNGGSWPCFLGPNRDNMSTERGLLQTWPADGPRPAWRCSGLGQGFSTVSISGGTVYTLGTPDNQESVLAIDLETGKPRWSVLTGGAVFPEAHGSGPRSTPTIDGDRVYALGATGMLVCVDAKTQSVRWQKNVAQEFGAAVLQYGFSESVLIDGPRLICTPGGQLATVVALDKMSGDVVWKCVVPGLPRASYASPLVAKVAGARQYIDLLSQGVAGVRAEDGRLLWANAAPANPQPICTTPLFVQDHVFTSSAYGVGSALIRLAEAETGVSATLVNQTRELKSHHGGLVAVHGFVYGYDDEILTCFSLEGWRSVWKSRSVGKGSLTYADGNLYVRSEAGPVALVQASPDGYHEKGRFAPSRHNSGPAWSYPVVAAGRLFLRDQDDLLCYWVREGK